MARAMQTLVSGQGYLVVNYRANERLLSPKDELGL